MNGRTNTNIPHCKICGFGLLQDALEEHHISEEETVLLCANCHRTLETILESLYHGRKIPSKKLAEEDPRYWKKLENIVHYIRMKYEAVGYSIPDTGFIPKKGQYEEKMG